MTEMFGEAWSPMSVPDLAPDDDDDLILSAILPHLVLFHLQFYLTLYYAISSFYPLPLSYIRSFTSPYLILSAVDPPCHVKGTEAL